MNNADSRKNPSASAARTIATWLCADPRLASSASMNSPDPIASPAPPDLVRLRTQEIPEKHLRQKDAWQSSVPPKKGLSRTPPEQWGLTLPLRRSPSALPGCLMPRPVQRPELPSSPSGPASWTTSRNPLSSAEPHTPPRGPAAPPGHEGHSPLSLANALSSLPLALIFWSPFPSTLPAGVTPAPLTYDSRLRPRRESPDGRKDAGTIRTPVWPPA